MGSVGQQSLGKASVILCALLAALHCSGGDGRATIAEDPGDSNYPEGCEFLAEGNEDPNCSSLEAQCEEALASDEAYEFSFQLVDENLSDEEIQRRVDCIADWLEGLGHEPVAYRNLGVVSVTAPWEDVSVVAETAAVESFDVYCAEGDCECGALDEGDCEQDPFCRPIEGMPIDEDRMCTEPGTYAGCVGIESSCGDAESNARAPDGSCWSFVTDCDVPGFDSTDCGGLDVGDGLPECE